MREKIADAPSPNPKTISIAAMSRQRRLWKRITLPQQKVDNRHHAWFRYAPRHVPWLISFGHATRPLQAHCLLQSDPACIAGPLMYLSQQCDPRGAEAPPTVLPRAAIDRAPYLGRLPHA